MCCATRPRFSVFCASHPRFWAVSAICRDNGPKDATCNTRAHPEDTLSAHRCSRPSSPPRRVSTLPSQGRRCKPSHAVLRYEDHTLQSLLTPQRCDWRGRCCARRVAHAPPTPALPRVPWTVQAVLAHALPRRVFHLCHTCMCDINVQCRPTTDADRTFPKRSKQWSAGASPRREAQDPLQGTRQARLPPRHLCIRNAVRPPAAVTAYTHPRHPIAGVPAAFGLMWSISLRW